MYLLSARLLRDVLQSWEPKLGWVWLFQVQTLESSTSEPWLQTSAACAARSAAPSCSAKRRHSLSTAGDGASAARGLLTAPGCGTAASAAGCRAPSAAPAVPAPRRARFGGRSAPSAVVPEALAGGSAPALASTYARVAKRFNEAIVSQHSPCKPASCSASAHLMPVVKCCDHNAGNTHAPPHTACARGATRIGTLRSAVRKAAMRDAHLRRTASFATRPRKSALLPRLHVRVTWEQAVLTSGKGTGRSSVKRV